MNGIKSTCVVALLVMATGFVASPVSATLISSLPGGTIITMPDSNYFGADPQIFGPTITWTSTNTNNQGGSVFGYNGGYSFSSNGYWDIPVMAGLNDSFDNSGIIQSMTFSFNSPVAGVGGFINYLPGSSPTMIAVYDSGMTLIESATLNFTTTGDDNAGFFLGFLEDTSNISFFVLTDNYIGITDLTLSSPAVNPVPEPATIILLSFGILGVGVIRKIRELNKW